MPWEHLFQFGNVLGESPKSLLAGLVFQAWPNLLRILRVRYVETDRFLERFLEPFEAHDGLTRFVPRFRSTPVPAIDGSIRIQKKDRPGEKSIKLKPVQIEAPALNDADADKLLQEILKFLINGDSHLAIQGLAGQSRHSPKRNQERLSRPGRLRLSGFQVIVDPKIRGTIF